MALFVAIFVGLGIHYLTVSHAATSSQAVEAERGTQTGQVCQQNDQTASGNAAVIFGSTCSAASLVGINWHPNYINNSVQDVEMDLLQQAHVKAVRIDIEWSAIEYQKGVYNQTYLARLDHAIDGLVARGIDPLLLVSATPAWVSGAPSTDTNYSDEPPLRSTIINPVVNGVSDCDPTKTICQPYGLTPDPVSGVPEGIQDYDTFLSFVVHRWDKQAHEYEIWNEAAGGLFWRSSITTSADAGKLYLETARTNADDYTMLLKSAYTTAKMVAAADKQPITILGGSDSGTDLINQTFITEMYADGAKGYLDVFSQHYYCDPPGHNYCGSTAANQRTLYDPVTTANLYTTNIYNKILKKYDPTIPVWVTETGYTTVPNGGISQSQAADYLTQTFDTAATLPNVSRLYWYDTDSGYQGSSGENYYGVIAANTYNVNALPACQTNQTPQTANCYSVTAAYTALQQLGSVKK